MKSLTIFSFAILALTVGCDDAPAQNNGNYQNSQSTPVQYQNQNNGNYQNSQQQDSYTQASQSQSNGGDEIVMHTVKNQKTGQPFCYVPVPASWKAIPGAQAGEPSTSGPNGLTITSFPIQNYIYTNDQFMNQSYQSNGVQVMAPVGIETVVSQKIIPQGRQMGMKLVNQYPLPAVAANLTAYTNRIPVPGSQSIQQAAGSDWIDAKGNKVFVVVQYYETRSSAMISWGYNVNMLKVEPSDFEKAKKQYIYAMANTKYDQNDINNTNAILANDQRKIQQSNMDTYRSISETNRKGAADRAKINQDANAYVSNLNKASNAFRNHNEEIVQQQMNNALTDVNVVVNPYDGKQYEVESGSQTYWMDPQGNYMKSDNSLYNPNDYETYPWGWEQAPLKEYK